MKFLPIIDVKKIMGVGPLVFWATVFLANLLVFGLAGLSAHNNYRHFQESAEVTTHNLAHMLEKETTGTLRTIDEALFAVLEKYHDQQRLGQLDRTELNAQIARIHQRLPIIDALRITDERGLLIMGSGVDAAQQVSLADRPHFIRLRDDAKAGLLFSVPQLSRVSKTWVIAMARRITRPDGQFGGMIFAAISLDHFARSFSALNLGSDGMVALRDAQMHLLARYPAPPTTLEQTELSLGSASISPELKQLIQQGKNSATFRARLNSKTINRTLTFHKLQDYPLNIIVGLAPSDYLSAWRRDTLKLGVLALLFMLTTFTGASLLYRAWQRQQQANEKLANQTALYHDLVEDNAMFIMRFLPDTTIIFANAAFAQFLGQTVEQITHHRWLEFLPEENDKNALHAMIAALSAEHPVSTFNEIHAANFHGEICCTRWSHHAFFDAQGVMTHLQSTGIDVSERKLAEFKLAASELHLRTIIETEPECIKIVDANMILTQMNPAGLEMIEAEHFEQVAGRSVLGIIAPEYRNAYTQMHHRVLAGKTSNLEYEIIGLKGGRRWLETHAVAMQTGDQIVHLALTRDISHRKQAEASQRLASSVFTHTYEGIMFTDADNRIIDINPAFTRITGYSRDECIGHSPTLLASGRHGSEFYTALWQALRGQDFWRGEIWNRRKNGEIYAELLTLSAIRDDTGKLLHYIGVFSDISQLKMHEAELHRIAHYDILTGVANRRLLADQLGQAIAHSLHNNKSLAICYLDLDGFKSINDQYGHAAGDQLLVEITERLKNLQRTDDTLARLGGDEFILLFANLTQEQGCHTILDRVLNAVSQPVTITHASVSLPVSVSASIGVTLFPDDDSDADTLLRHADQAMYLAKEGGKNRYHQFNPDQDRQAHAHRIHLQRLTEALTNQEFVLHYQPKVNLINGDVIGAEALIRWQHPEQGLLPPSAFLHYLNGNDLEITVGKWVIAAVLKQLSLWNAAGLHLKVSLNISANHLLQADFADVLQQNLECYPEVNPAEVELEILETAALDDIAHATRILIACHALGVSFALDDFGTGYSSLTYFRTLPIDTLKIDQSFVRNMLNDPEDFGIVESVVRLAQAFNREVIAEGVETLEQGSMLLHMGCTQAQGYGIGRPMPAEHMTNWIEQWRNKAAWLTLDSRLTDREDLSLLVAEQSHRNWINSIVEQLDYPEADAPISLDSQHCRFGRWYFGRGTVRYGALQEFKDIEIPHEQVHRLGREMIALAQSGQVDAARKHLPKLFQLRDKLLVLLDTLIEIAATTAK